jgi:hypothetical protein
MPPFHNSNDEGEGEELENAEENEGPEEEFSDEDYDVIEAFPRACLTSGSFTGYDRLVTLVSAQNKCSVTTPGSTEADFDLLLKHLQNDGVENPELPPTLKRLYQVATKWNLYDLQIFPATEACTPKLLHEFIFVNNAQQRKELGVQVAEPGWIGLGVTGDNYGMIMVNCNAASPYFGEVWNYTNNCNDEKKMASCLDTMLERIMHFLEWNECSNMMQSLKLEYEVFNTMSNLMIFLKS